MVSDRIYHGPAEALMILPQLYSFIYMLKGLLVSLSITVVIDHFFTFHYRSFHTIEVFNMATVLQSPEHGLRYERVFLLILGYLWFYLFLVQDILEILV